MAFAPASRDIDSERDRERAEAESRWAWREREREIEVDAEAAPPRDDSLERDDMAGRVFWRFAFRFGSSGGGVPVSVSSENRECRKTLL